MAEEVKIRPPCGDIDAALADAVLETLIRLLPDAARAVEESCRKVVEDVTLLLSQVEAQEKAAYALADADVLADTGRAIREYSSDIIMALQFQDRNTQRMTNACTMLKNWRDAGLTGADEGAFAKIYGAITLDEMRHVFVNAFNGVSGDAPPRNAAEEQGHIELF